MLRKRKQIQVGSSLEQLEEKHLLSTVFPTAYVDPISAPAPAPATLPPACVYPCPTQPTANTTPESPLLPPPAQQDPSLPPLVPDNPPLEPYLPAAIVTPVAYVDPTPPPSPTAAQPPRIDLSAPAWPTAPAQAPVYGPYDPNDPLQQGVTVPPSKPYYGPKLPEPGPSIFDAKPAPMPTVPSLYPPTLPY